MSGNTGMGKMHLDLYTNNAALTQKAKFWCNFVSSLKDRGDGGLVVLDDVDAIVGRHRDQPSIWSLFQPRDVTLYDLIYEPYLGRSKAEIQQLIDDRKISGAQDLRAPDERVFRTIHPSIVESLPDDFPDLKHEFSKLESQMFDRPRKRATEPLTPILPEAHDRIFTPGYAYNPVHTEIYGTYRPRSTM